MRMKTIWMDVISSYWTLHYFYSVLTLGWKVTSETISFSPNLPSMKQNSLSNHIDEDIIPRIQQIQSKLRHSASFRALIMMEKWAKEQVRRKMRQHGKHCRGTTIVRKGCHGDTGPWGSPDHLVMKWKKAFVTRCDTLICGLMRCSDQ